MALFGGYRDGLGAGEVAGSIGEVRSSAGQYRLVMQGDGNLVLYTQEERVLWSSGTDGDYGAYAVMQTDGNLVIYSPAGTALWSSGTYGHPGAGLAVQDDGNVVIYDGSTALWSTATRQDGLGSGDSLLEGQQVSSPSGHYHFVMQTDGNLVMYTESGRPIWDSHTDGNPGAYAFMQTDGNLVVYSSAHVALWASGTDGHPSSRFAVQDDGNLVIYNANTPIWSSGSIDARLGPGDTLTAGQSIYAPDDAYRVVMQGDGNLVLYTASEHALWSSNTGGHGGAYAVMQSDGNLVVYAADRSVALWNSGTEGYPGAFFAIQNDGNGVIYQVATPLFATNTAQGGAPSPSSTGAPTAAAEAAAEEAEARLGQVYSSENPNASWWSGYCETFVWLVYGRRWRFPSAIAEYYQRLSEGRIHGGTPPRGAEVFYGGGLYGHVTVGVGGGQVVGTLGYEYQRLPISRTSYTYFGRYLGWAVPF